MCAGRLRAAFRWDSQVRVYGVSPGKGEQPAEIVRASWRPRPATRRTSPPRKEYLTRERRQDWDPLRGPRCFEQAPDARVETDPGDRDGNGKTVVLSGERIATVDATHAYRPDEEKYEAAHPSHAARVGVADRRAAAGLVLGESDFQRIYRSVNKYYFATLGPDAEDSGGGRRPGRRPGLSAAADRPGHGDRQGAAGRPDGLAGPGGQHAFPAGTALGRHTASCRWTIRTR